MLDCTALDAEGLPRSRAKAVAVGARRYFTGEPCKRGHIAARHTQKSTCCVCQRAAINSHYARNKSMWRANRAAGISTDRVLFWAKQVVWAAKRRAAAKRIAFDISAEYVASIAVPVCPVLGCGLLYVAEGGVRHNSAQLDRITPSLGYVVGNVAVISYRANTIKNDATPEELLAVAAWAEKARG